MASGPRLELLDLLSQGPKTVEPLARQAGQSVANASRHLQVLRSARLVNTRRDGVHVEYSLANQRVADFCLALRGLARARLYEINEATTEVFGAQLVESLDRADLVKRVRRGEVTLLDVRPREEFEAAHIKGAISVPLEELEARLEEIPDDASVVAYCRGPYCVWALEAVEVLEASGLDAARLEDGVQEWRAHGLPVEEAS